MINSSKIKLIFLLSALCILEGCRYAEDNLGMNFNTSKNISGSISPTSNRRSPELNISLQQNNNNKEDIVNESQDSATNNKKANPYDNYMKNSASNKMSEEKHPQTNSNIQSNIKKLDNYMNDVVATAKSSSQTQAKQDIKKHNSDVKMANAVISKPASGRKFEEELDQKTGAIISVNQSNINSSKTEVVIKPPLYLQYPERVEKKKSEPKKIKQTRVKKDKKPQSNKNSKDAVKQDSCSIEKIPEQNIEQKKNVSSSVIVKKNISVQQTEPKQVSLTTPPSAPIIIQATAKQEQESQTIKQEQIPEVKTPPSAPIIIQATPKQEQESQTIKQEQIPEVKTPPSAPIMIQATPKQEQIPTAIEAEQKDEVQYKNIEHDNFKKSLKEKYKEEEVSQGYLYGEEDINLPAADEMVIDNQQNTLPVSNILPVKKVSSLDKVNNTLIGYYFKLKNSFLIFFQKN